MTLNPPVHLAVVGVSQHRSPLAIRESLAVDPASLPDALSALRDCVAEGFVLSTCNRVEVYAGGSSRDEAELAGRRFLESRHGGKAAPLARTAYCRHDDAAVRHLFRVASGLDSMVLGEAQISGQLRSALDAARAAGLLGGTLGPLGAAALACGKRVRVETGIGSRAASVVSVGLAEVERVVGSLSNRHVVIVGAGSTAQLVVKHLGALPAVRVTLIGRTPARAASLATRYGVPALPFGELTPALQTADVLITCTAAPHHVVLEAHFEAAGYGRDDRSLVCLDLGVPRDVDPAVSRLRGVRLIDIDRMQVLSDLDRSERDREASHAARLVDADVERFLHSWRMRDVIPAIVEVRRIAEATRDDELARVLPRLSHLSERDLALVESLVRRVVGKLMHGPTAALRASGDAGLADAARQLFAQVPRGTRSGDGPFPATPSAHSPHD